MRRWLLVHSPLLGPTSWTPVADALRAAGAEVTVPDLRPALRAGEQIAAQCAERAAVASTGPLVVAGHSGAGPLLPAVAAALGARGAEVCACVFVDAGLPHPGRSRRSTFPADLLAHLDGLTVDGWLPPWPQWWPADALAELLPDAPLRAALADDCPPLPVRLFDEPLPGEAALPPSGYVLLSPPYAEAAEAAADLGWPVLRLDADHLAPLTRAAEVAPLMVAAAEQASEIANAARRHVARFNRAVRSGDWAEFTAGFATDATMRFPNVPVGPFSGRAEIRRGYEAQPPTDTMTVRSITVEPGGSATVRFAWDAGGEGTLQLHWHENLVTELVVTFG